MNSLKIRTTFRSKFNCNGQLQMACDLHCRDCFPGWWKMTLRIERNQGGIRLSGELRVGHLDQVKTEIEHSKSPIVLDLEELDLIDVEGVRFLNACEAAGVSILHCRPYIREWMLQERGPQKEHPEP
jgi:hypothetical protein